jgi:hypothetical protein
VVHPDVFSSGDCGMGVPWYLGGRHPGDDLGEFRIGEALASMLKLWVGYQPTLISTPSARPCRR